MPLERSKPNYKGYLPKATAVDLYCGVGGLTRGLLDSGIEVVAGYDIDVKCEYAYTHNNPGAKFIEKSVTELTGRALAKRYPKDHVRILVGCAPCQTFSRLSQGKRSETDEKWALLGEFTRLICEVNPDVVSMENVPELQQHPVFDDFLAALTKQGYFFEEDRKKHVVFCPDYGIPQQRRRLVVLASKLAPISILPPTHKSNRYKSVKSVLGGLPKISDGAECTKDRLHKSSKLSSLNLKRIRASKPGGSWRDWPSSLVADCHREESGKTYPSVYGRMEWDKPSPTITTQFYGFGNGRFGHPTQDRALSLREGAILQSFPPDYEFAPPDSVLHFKAIGRMIGNAVPVRLGEIIGRTISRHIRHHRSR